MTRVNQQGYVERRGGKGSRDGEFRSRTWWIVKYDQHGIGGEVWLGFVRFRKELVGKKVSFRMELAEQPQPIPKYPTDPQRNNHRG